MRFTEVQVALYKAGINFVHMAPDGPRCLKAEEDFREAMGMVSDDHTPWESRFVVCSNQGASCDHVPVMFVEDPMDCQQRPLAEAMMIPAAIGGIGPMVIR